MQSLIALILIDFLLGYGFAQPAPAPGVKSIEDALGTPSAAAGSGQDAGSAANQSLPSGDSMANDFKKHISNILSNDPKVRKNALKEIREAGIKATPALEDCVSNGTTTLFLRQICAEFWNRAQHSKDYASIKHAAFNDADPRARSRAIRSIGEFRSEESIRDLFSLSQSEPDVFARTGAIRQLAYRGRHGVLELLRKLYADEKNLELRLHIATEMGRYGDKSARSLAIETLKAKNQPLRVREGAIAALAMTCKAKDIELVEAIIADKSEDSWVLSAAKRAIPHMRYAALPDEKQWEYITEMLGSEKNYLQGWAVSQLEFVRTTRARKTLEEVSSNPSHPAAAMALEALLRLMVEFD